MRNWENLSGRNKWEELLEPLNDDLRRYIIHYGEMVETTYNAYDSENDVCKYQEGNLFSEVGLGIGRTRKKYEITQFIYATAKTYPSFKKDTNWIGYVAVATDEGKRELGRRDIVVAWRGSKEWSEWENNIKFFLIYPTKIFGDRGSLLRKFKRPSSLHEYNNLKVHRGFYKMYTMKNNESTLSTMSASNQVREEVSRLLEKYKNDTISVTMTGHSLGGALAILSAMDIEINVVKYWNNVNPSTPRPHVTAFTFGCPQFGNSDFVESLNTEYLHILRIENKPDIVPRVLPWVGNVLVYINTVQGYILQSAFNINAPDVLNKLAKFIVACNRGFSRVVHKITHHYYTDVGQELVMDTDKSYHLKRGQGIIEDIKMAHNMEVYLHGISGTQGVANPFKSPIERDIALLNKDGDFLDESHQIPGSWWDKPNKANMVQREDGSWEHVQP